MPPIPPRSGPPRARSHFKEVSLTAVGDALTGTVVSVDRVNGVAYLLETTTGRRFSATRSILDGAFHALVEGRGVRFRVNRFDSVVTVQL